jgi:drug/metabolite transporter (DMT)-like permease
MRPTLRPALVLLLVALVWGSVGTIVREIPLPAAAIAAGRVWVAALVLGALLASGRVSGPPLFSVHRGRLCAVGAILTVHWIALFAAYQRMPVARAVFVLYLGPVLMAALAPRVLGERNERRTLVALAVALLGFLVLAGPTLAGGDRNTTPAGLALAVIAALTFAALVLVSKPLAEVYGGIRLTFAQLVVSGALLVPVALTQRWGSPRAAWWWIVVLGVVHTAAALAAYSASLAKLPVAMVGTLAYVEPVAAGFCAWVVLNEHPTFGLVVGATLVLAAGLAVVTAGDDEVAAIAPGSAASAAAAP